MNWMKEIEKYIPSDEQEENDKRIIIDFVNKNKNVLTRENEIAHITSSGFIVNKNRDKSLMIHHNIYNSWAWTGGHADGEDDLLGVAIREAQEETGIKTVKPITDNICSIDILSVVGHVKKGKYVSPHLHLSIAYILEAEEDEELIVNVEENSGVRWIDIDEVLKITDEEHMKAVYSKLINKSKQYS